MQGNIQNLTKSPGIGDNQYIFHREIPLEKCLLISIPDLKPCKFLD